MASCDWRLTALLNSTTMNLMSSGPISKSISGKFNKEYDNLRYTAPRPIPSADNLDLTKEEDFLHPEEPKPQDYLATKVFSLVLECFTAILLGFCCNLKTNLGYRHVEPTGSHDRIICSRWENAHRAQCCRYHPHFLRSEPRKFEERLRLTRRRAQVNHFYQMKANWFDWQSNFYVFVPVIQNSLHRNSSPDWKQPRCSLGQGTHHRRIAERIRCSPCHRLRSILLAFAQREIADFLWRNPAQPRRREQVPSPPHWTRSTEINIRQFN